MIETLFYISFVLLDIVTMLNVVLLVEVPFGIKMETSVKKLTVASLLFMILKVALEYIFKLEMIPLLFCEYLFMVLAVVFFAKEKRIRAAFLSIPAVFIFLQWTTMFELLEILFDLKKYSFVVLDVMVTPFYYLMTLSLFFVLIFLKKHANKKAVKISLSLGEGILLTVFGFFSPVGVEVLWAIDEVFQNTVYNMAWIIFMLVLNISLIYGIAYRKREFYYRSLSESYKNQFNEEYEYFKEYKKSNAEISHFRHDWTNHMIVMQDLLQQGKYEEAKKYFEAFPTIKNQKRGKGLTGNEIVDTVLAAKADVMEESQIELTLEGNLVNLKKMEPVDICIIFSNIIDNAIEACINYEGKRYISIKVTESPNMLMVVIKNPMKGELKTEGNKIITTKKDKEIHGLGLQNIMNTMEKYQSECKIETSEGIFIIKLILQL